MLYLVKEQYSPIMPAKSCKRKQVINKIVQGEERVRKYYLEKMILHFSSKLQFYDK